MHRMCGMSFLQVTCVCSVQQKHNNRAKHLHSAVGYDVYVYNVYVVNIIDVY